MMVHETQHAEAERLACLAKEQVGSLYHLGIIEIIWEEWHLIVALHERSSSDHRLAILMRIF